MKQRNLQIAVAALALGVQLASPATAGIRQTDLSALHNAVMTGQTADMTAVIDQSPHLAQAVVRVGQDTGVAVLVKGGNGKSNNGVGNGNGGGRENNRGNHNGHGGGHY
jgi:hypothetical protein